MHATILRVLYAYEFAMTGNSDRPHELELIPINMNKVLT